MSSRAWLLTGWCWCHHILLFNSQWCVISVLWSVTVGFFLPTINTYFYITNNPKKNTLILPGLDGACRAAFCATVRRMEMISAMHKENNIISWKAHPTLNKPSIRTAHAAGALCPTHQNSQTTLDHKSTDLTRLFCLSEQRDVGKMIQDKIYNILFFLTTWFSAVFCPQTRYCIFS